jgi:hypothetical protein
MHRKAAEIFKNKSKPIEETDAVKIIKTLNKDIDSILEKMFRTCHSLIKHDRPVNDFLWFCEVDEMKSLYIGFIYRNINSTKSFIKSIAEVQFKNLSKILSETKFVCVIGDGSTDKSVLEQEMWLARTCKHGIIQTYFVDVTAAEKVNAENIVNGLKLLISQNLKIEFDEFFKEIGVTVLCLKMTRQTITVHCRTHR